MQGIKFENLKKTVVFFGMEDTLIPGNVEKQVDMDAVHELLGNLKEMEEEFPEFHMVLITGLKEEIALKKIKKYKLDDYFKEEKIFYVNEEYLKTKTAQDRHIYDHHIDKDSTFKDEYFKQIVISKFQKKTGIPFKKMVYIGHDVWSEAFYFTRGMPVDFALIKSSFSHLDERKERLVKGLIYINRDWKSIKKLILGKFSEIEEKHLKDYAFNTMKEKLLDKDTVAELKEKFAEKKRKDYEKLS